MLFNIISQFRKFIEYTKHSQINKLKGLIFGKPKPRLPFVEICSLPRKFKHSFSLQLSVESLDSIKLDLETIQISDGPEQSCNRDQSSKENTIDCELHTKNPGKKHGLVCQIRVRLYGMKAKVTPVVRFVKPEVFTEEKEGKNKNVFIRKLLSLKNKVSTTPVKRFVEPGEKKKKGPFGRLCSRTGKALYNLVIKIK